MRWPQKERRRDPVVGDRRTKVKFAFLPTKCNDATIRWLERIVVTEDYVAWKDYIDRGYYEMTGWVTMWASPLVGSDEGEK